MSQALPLDSTSSGEGRSLEATRPRGRWWRVLFCLLIGCFGAEVLARVMPGAPVPPVSVGRLHRPTSDRDQLYENRPGGSLVVDYSAWGEEPARRVVHKLNDQGFRGESLPLARTERPRIACVGDSHTFGHGVREHETWPALFQRLLEESVGHVEVLNAGVDAYDPYQEEVWLREKVLAYAPDIVLLQIHFNDACPRGLPSDGGQSVLYRWSHPQRAPSWVLRLRGGSRAVDRILRTLHSAQQVAVYRESMTSCYEDDHPGWRRARTAVQAMADLLRERGITFGVALYPALFELDGELISTEAFQHWGEFLTEIGVPFLDTSPAFLGPPLERLRVHPHDFHGNHRANACFARAVAEWVEVWGDPCLDQ